MIKKHLLFILLILGVCIMAIPSGSALSISAPVPSYVYRSSVIDLNYSTNLTGTLNCYFNFDGQHNSTLTDCYNETIQVPVNSGTLNLTVFENNGTAINSDTVEVTINNDFTTGKAVLLIGLLLLFLILPFAFWYACFGLNEMHTPVKLFLVLLGFFSIYLFLTLGLVIVENFIHNDAIWRILDALVFGYRWILYTIVVYFIIAYLFSLFELYIENKRRNK